MLKPSYRGEHRVQRLVCLLLRGTEKCSENGRHKQGKSGRKGSQGENSEENDSESDFIGLPTSASFFFGRERSVYFHWQESHFIPFRRQKYPLNRNGVNSICRFVIFASKQDFFPRKEFGGTERNGRESLLKTDRFYLYICLQVPAISLAFIRSGNKDFDCIHLHQKEEITTIKTILI